MQLMKTQLIKDILVSEPDGRLVTICGWVRTKRDSKNLCFIQVNDGSCFATIQLTFDRENANPNNENIENTLPNVTTGASIKATGKLIPSPASGQAVEVALETLEVLGVSPSDYPLQKKGHTVEFEAAADRRAVSLAAAAGYKADALLAVLARIKADYNGFGEAYPVNRDELVEQFKVFYPVEVPAQTVGDYKTIRTQVEKLTDADLFIVK